MKISCYFSFKEQASSKARGEDDSSKVAKESEEGGVLSVSEGSAIEDSEEEVSLISSARKRFSLSGASETSFGKRIKMELDKEEMDNLRVPPPLKIELELERNRRNEPFRKRNLNTILEELDLIGMKWKESSSQYMMPVRWGTPISRNCSEKWDSHFMPHKLFERYQRHLERSKPDADLEAGSPEAHTSEWENEIKGVEVDPERNWPGELGEEAAEAVDYEFYRLAKNQQNENSFSSDAGGRTRSRNKNQNRRRAEERASNENCGDHSMKGKHSKKGQFKGKKEQQGPRETRNLVVELEQYPNSYAKHENDESSDSNKNFEKLKIEDSASPISSPMVSF